VFQFLLNRNLIKKVYDKKHKSIFFWLEKQLYQTFLKIEKRVKFSPRYYLDKILCEQPPEASEIIEYDKNLETLKRWKFTNPQYEKEFEEIYVQITDFQVPLMENIEKNHFEIKENDLEIMDDLIIHLLKLIYLLSEEPYKVNNNQELFKVFRYSWLDNQELILYLNAKQNFKKKIISNKEQNKHFLKIYKDAYDTQILKIGRYINYNNILKIGTRELTDNEKRILNQARAIYEESLYKKSVDRYFDLIESRCRQWLFNIMELIFGLKWKQYLPQKFKNTIEKYKSSDIKKYGTPNQNKNELYYLSRGDYVYIFTYKKLWNVYFSKIIGTNNKDIILKLEQISHIANKVKHNPSDTDLKNLAPNIKEELADTCNILKILNRGYKNLLDTNNILFQKPNLYMCWSSQVDLNAVMPFVIDDNKANEVLNNIKDFIKKEAPIRGNFIDIGKRSKIQLNFSCSYREFIAYLCYLIKIDKIRIKDYEGSSFSFEFP